MPPEHTETNAKCEASENLTTTIAGQDLDLSFPSAPTTEPNHSCNINNNLDNNSLGLDAATEVFRASLEFQQSHVPPPTSFERATSASSLYPSLEFVTKVGEGMEIERSWHDAAFDDSAGGEATRPMANDANSKRAARNYRILQESRKQKSQDISHSNQKQGVSSSVEAARGTTAFVATARTQDTSTAAARASMPKSSDDDDLIALKRAAYGGDYCATHVDVRDTTHAVAQSMDHHQAEAFVIDEQVHPSDLDAGGAVRAEFVHENPVAFAGSVNHSSAYVASTDVFHQESTLNAMAATHAEAAEATVIESSPMGVATQGLWNTPAAAEATVLHEEDVAVEVDRKPPAIDHSEPWAVRRASADRLNPSIHSFAGPADQEAEATVIGYDVPASETSFGVAHAESTAQPSAVFEARASQEAEATFVDYETQPSEIAADAVQTEYHTVGTADQDAEAMVVDYDMHPTGTTFDTLSNQQDVGSSTNNFDPSLNPRQAEATVVDYNVHPSELCSVQAEFVGQNFNAQVREEVPVGQPPLHAAQATGVSGSVQQVYEVDGTNTEEATEATVIESGPMHKATHEAWSAEPREAQVIEDTTGVQHGVDSKPRGTEDVDDGGFAMAHGAAEVVEIEESTHPAELVGDAARAELIGPDYGCAIAVQQQGATPTGGQEIVEEATYVVEETSDGLGQPSVHSHFGQDTHEAQATLVADEVNVIEDADAAHQTHSVTAVLQESYMTPPVEALGEPATPVTVMQGSIGNDSTPTTHSTTPKADPLADRSTSAPTISKRQSSDSPQDSRSYSCGARTTREVDSSSLQEERRSSSTSLPPIPPPTIPPPIPSPSLPVRANSGTSRVSRARSESSNSQSGGLQSLSSNICRGTNNVMEMLFGNSKSPVSRKAPAGFDSESLAGCILPRSPLPTSVIYSQATNSWVATVNTSQKALEANNVEESSKALRAFSVPTKKQAIALARAWAPPRMLPFESNQRCFICETQFALLRRACHCRNCGVVVCGSCVVQWPSKMLPTTYNTKKETSVKICKGCDWLCSAFRLALLHGEHDKAVALHSTGNINLTTPFANVKGELFYPVHCAVLGGDLGLLKWLVDEHCCPLRSIRISHGKEKDSYGSYTPILTSKGRSLLGIALSNRNIGIVRYLVAEKRMMLAAEKGLSVDTLVQNLDLVLRVLPEEVLGGQDFDASERTSSKDLTPSKTQSVTRTISESGDGETVEGASNHESTVINARREGSEGDVSDFEECIICFSNAIDCVATPCGHQICCLECGQSFSRCPVCLAECSFMRVFKP